MGVGGGGDPNTHVVSGPAADACDGVGVAAASAAASPDGPNDADGDGDGMGEALP